MGNRAKENWRITQLKARAVWFFWIKEWNSKRENVEVVEIGESKMKNKKRERAQRASIDEQIGTHIL